MKDNDYKRIENQLEPDDRLVRNVIVKASELSANSVMAEDYLRDHDVPETITVKHNSAYKYILSAVAALALVFGVGAYMRSNNAVKTHLPDASSVEEKVAEVTESTPETVITDDAPSTESVAEVTESKVDIIESTADKTESIADESEAEIPDDGRSEWRPDKTADSLESGNGNGEVAALAHATEEYRSFEMNGKTYYSAWGNYGEIYDETFILGNNILNSSYIDELIANVDVDSMFADIGRPAAQAEVYSLKYADPDYYAAVRFIDVNGDERFYLFADNSRSFDTLAEHLLALNTDIYTFDGTAIIRRNGVRYFIDEDSTLKEMILSADGEKTDTAYGEAGCEIFLDTPAYGGSVGYTVYSDGYIAINAFGSESVYNVGTETTAQMISYVNENCHG